MPGSNIYDVINWGLLPSNPTSRSVCGWGTHSVRWRQRELVQSGLCVMFRGLGTHRIVDSTILSAAPQFGGIAISILLVERTSDIPILIWERCEDKNWI